MWGADTAYHEKTIVFHKKPEAWTTKEAQRKGLPTETLKREAASASKGVLHKYERDVHASATEDLGKAAALPILPPNMRQDLIRARVASGWNQTQLAQRANVPVALVQALETGKPVQDRAVLDKIRRVLPGVALRFMK